MQRKWDKRELQAAVNSYMEMKRKEVEGITFSKKNIMRNFQKNLIEHKNHLNTECRIFLMFFLKW